MAVDEGLLIDAAEYGVATLRFYGWSEPTLSLGYFQRYADRFQHAPSRDCAIVRRQTGGGAILHDRELTYSLTLPAGHRLNRKTQSLYAAVHDAFVAAIEPALASGRSHWTLLRREIQSKPSPKDDPFLCFQRRAPGDVVLVANSSQNDAASQTEIVPRSDWKILGSAQRRYRGAILQHGSLLLERSPAAPELPGLRDLAGSKLDLQQVIDGRRFAAAASVRLAAALDVRLLKSDFPPELELIAEELANSKYRHAGWTNRR
jgi:lipoate-protein ligase A